MEEYNGFTEQERLNGDRIIKKAIKNGDLPPLNQTKCCICGQNKGVREYHCEDYTPENILNDVVPLCYACHRRLHKNKYNNPERWENYKKEVRNGNLCPPHYTDYWTEYDDLNEDQQVIVKDEKYKFLSVQAGPGSGKTHTLVEKVRYMVNELNEEPETFLIITFSDNAAEEIRDRLISSIPASDIQKMQISTIHSFCLKFLEETEIDTIGLDVVGEDDALYLFIKKHLNYLGFKDECYVQNYEIPNIIKKYKEFSTFGVRTDELAEYLEKFEINPKFVEYVHEYMKENEGEFPTNDELKEKEAELEEGETSFRESYTNAKYRQIAKSYKKYLELLKKERAIDFNQMQIKALKLMNDGHIPEYSNIFIDEFQDTDPIQMEIFKKLISPKTNPKIKSVTVVGDVDQSIYGFRGGSNKDYFKELKKLEDVKFEEKLLSINYRSTEEIIDFTQDFISHQHDTPKELTCGSDKHNDVYFMVNEDKGTEAENILEVIKYIMADKRMKLSDIGILMRSVTQKSTCKDTLIKLFKENDINYQLIGTGDLKDVDELKYLLTLMYLLIQDDDPFSTFVPKETADWLNFKTLTGANGNRVLFELSEETKKELNERQEEFECNVKKMDKKLCSENKDWGCNGINDFKGIFSNKAKKRQDEVFSCVKKPIPSDENLINWGITNERDLEFFHKLNDLKRRVNAEYYRDRPTIADVYFELLCDITGYLTADLVNNEEEITHNLAAIVPSMSLYGQVLYEKSLRGAFWFIMRVMKSLDAYKPEGDGIEIMTVHKSKGKEFPVVILPSFRLPAVNKNPNRDRGFPSEFRPEYEESVDYIPEEFLTYPRYERDAEDSHTQEEERVIYVAKTRAEDELILSSIMKGSSKDVEKALKEYTPENIKSIEKAPDCVNDVIDKNLDYCKLINPKNIDINILNPKIKPEKEEIVDLSFTAIESYNECPFRYKLSEKFSFNFSNKKQIDDGIFIHSALEIINKKIIVNKGYIGDDEVSKTVKDLFEKNYLKDEKEQLDELNEKLEEYGKQIEYGKNIVVYKEKLERYNDKIESIKEKIRGYGDKLEYMTKDVIRYYNKIGNNRKIKYSEYPFYIKGENYAFSGVVDLIYEKDGKLGILDYKNTKITEGKYRDKYEKQLHYYVMALRDENNEFEGQKIEEIEIYAIRKDELISFEIREDLIEKLRDELESIAGKIKNNEFEQNCENCGECPFIKICKK